MSKHVRRSLSTALEVVGLAGLTVGAASITPAAGWIAGGLSALLYARGLTR